MRVNLISPRSPVASVTKRDRAVQFSRLSLTTVAALFPSDTDIKIINDSLDEIDFDEKVDMVGITTITSTAPRAYEIADEFRKRKVPVIMGGIHPSVLPNEASLHADAVVIGEAEGVMDRLLEDFRSGNLQKFYSSTERPDLSKLPLPRKDLLYGNKFYREMDMVQTTRGCPFNCDFCSVSDFFG
ncbi:MAG TPA: cobalamin-dependent protein, partial [bacterium]|nr:cobalamin-dependent protein [bacterium]